MTRNRRYVFTLNNYLPEQVDLYDTLVQRVSNVQYLCYGKEVGESGTPHLQGFVYFRQPVTFTAVQAALPGNPHIEPAVTLEQAIEYCQKDGNFVEFGKKPMLRSEKGKAGGEAEIAAYEHARKCAQEGKFEEIRADIYVRHYSMLKRIYADVKQAVVELSQTDNYWIYGSAGIGKSRYVRHHWPDLYDKLLNKWWEGYSNEPTVLLDDMGPWSATNGGLSDMLKRWADRYPFRAEVKGAAVLIRPQRIVVTSQYRIEDLWSDEETRSALLRRFKVVHLVFPWVPPVGQPEEGQLLTSPPEKA